MITLEQFTKGITNYYESEFCQKANGLEKFAAYFMMPSIPGMIHKRVEQFKNSPLSDGLFNSDGLIDIDSARDRAQIAMKHCGSVDVIGFRLNSSDVDAIYESIMRA